MDLGYLGIVAVLVVGVAVVVHGWLGDRAETRRRQQALSRAPDRYIPGLDPNAPGPRYLTGDELRVPPRDRPGWTTAEATDLRQRLQGAPSLPRGHADPEFATEPDGLCVLPEPLILVADAEVITVRELLGFLNRARQAARPVVLVAPAFEPQVLTTLVVNRLQGHLSGCAVVMASAEERRALCSLVGARPLSLADLRSGYLPPESLGTCGTWASSVDQCWLLGEKG